VAFRLPSCCHRAQIDIMSTHWRTCSSKEPVALLTARSRPGSDADSTLNLGASVVAMKITVPNEAERFHVGTTIAGRYLVERPIAEGSMGAVALARHVSLDEKVAIKFVRPELRRDPSAITRLSREAKALARIKSDHVCRVLDVGVTLSVGPYMVLEYLEGTDLGAVLEKEGPLPAERAVECVLQACEALTVAHTAGITHRALEPRHLFLARHGQFETLKVLGFGVADDAESLGAPALPGVTRASESFGAALGGAPTYMSPERVMNTPGADHRSDIWSMGVVLHELVTGNAVFEAPTPAECRARVVSSAPVELALDDAVLPPSLRSIIARCLERDPERRFQSVEELAAALAPLATMRERFRGRSTGAFARKLVEEELSLSKTQRFRLAAAAGGTPATPAEASLAVRTGLREVGAGMRELARALPAARFHERPVWLYAAVALASSFTVVLVASLSGGVQWVTPPPVQAERVNASLGQSPEASATSASNPPEPRGPSEAAGPDDVMGTRMGQAVPPERTRSALDAEPSAAGHSGPARTFVSGSDATARPPQRKSRPRGHERAEPERERRRAAARAAKTSATHDEVQRSRVRLVEDNVLTNRPQPKRPRDLPVDSGAKAGNRDFPGDTRGKPASGSSGLPEWLEAIKRDSNAR
jgi:eukaryotic-like serine/threonine-protein kinase